MDKKFYYCFLDESNDDDFFILGGVVFERDKKKEIKKVWNGLKDYIGIPEHAQLKWNVNNLLYKDQIKNKYINLQKDWLSKYHEEILQAISNLDLKVVVSIHQDIRWKKRIKSQLPEKTWELIPSKWKNSIKRWKGIKGLGNLGFNPLDFYEEAFKYVLQRLAKEYPNEEIIKTFYLDFPPNYKNNLEHRLNKEYIIAYQNGFTFFSNKIEPLKDLGFEEHLNFIIGKTCTFCQIADICVGAVRNWCKRALQGKSNGNALDFLKIIRKNFFISDNKIVGYGFVVFPPQAPIYDLAYKYIDNVELNLLKIL